MVSPVTKETLLAGSVRFAASIASLWENFPKKGKGDKRPKGLYAVYAPPDSDIEVYVTVRDASSAADENVGHGIFVLASKGRAFAVPARNCEWHSFNVFLGRETDGFDGFYVVKRRPNQAASPILPISCASPKTFTERELFVVQRISAVVLAEGVVV